MAVALLSQALVTVDEAIAYLQDQGFPADDGDLLKTHINGVTGGMLSFMGRKAMVWNAGEQIEEYRAGDGSDCLYLKDAPVQNLVSVTLLPHSTTPTMITGPGTALSNDYVWYDRLSGLVTLKGRIFSSTANAAKIVYEAGFSATDPNLASLKLIALDAIASKWKRWKDKKQGVASESRGDISVSYSPTDFADAVIDEMRKHRRHLFA